MQLRTFSARSTAAVLTQIKDELGPDAVILDTQEEDGVITMTAALERGPGARQSGESEGHGADAADDSRAGSRSNGRTGGFEPIAGGAASTYSMGGGLSGGFSGAAAQSHHGSAPVGWQQWHEEWGTIKTHLLALMKPALKLDQLPPRQRLAIEFLQREGVEDEAVLGLFQRLQSDPGASILGPLGQMVPVRPWDDKHWPQRIQVFAGPFGAGKTSVAIRMALSLRRAAPSCRICLINADATRGNGRLLLRHYCDLSDMAYKEASTTMELVAALNLAEKEGFDKILVDLPGLSRGRALATLLADAGLEGRSGETKGDVAVHLTLPPHYGTLQLRGILERYRTPHAGSIVWTKLDEAEHYGQIVNVAIGTGLPVSALSFGPGLGNSLAPVKESMLWRLLFKRELPVCV